VGVQCKKLYVFCFGVVFLGGYLQAFFQCLSLNFSGAATEMVRVRVVFWCVFNFLKPFSFKLLGVIFQISVRPVRMRFDKKYFNLFLSILGDLTEMRQIFSWFPGLFAQDCGSISVDDANDRC